LLLLNLSGICLNIHFPNSPNYSIKYLNFISINKNYLNLEISKIIYFLYLSKNPPKTFKVKPLIFHSPPFLGNKISFILELNYLLEVDSIDFYSNLKSSSSQFFTIANNSNNFIILLPLKNSNFSLNHVQNFSDFFLIYFFFFFLNFILNLNSNLNYT
jgi:hypothetical protein